jgi:hypothetical protein
MKNLNPLRPAAAGLLFICTLAAVLAAGSAPAADEAGGIRWKKTVLDKKFRAEGAAVADVNADGNNDILAGEFWYEAPDWTPHEIRPPKEYDAAGGYSEAFLTFAMDVDGDLLPDQIVIDFPGKPALWRKNPGRRATTHWEQFQITDSACNESVSFVDLDGDDRPELIAGYKEQQMAFYTPGKNPKEGWEQHLIGEPGKPGVARFAHGLGVGDVNGDKYPDIITTGGYYQAPIDIRRKPWMFVPARLGGDCAQMHSQDFDGDGDMDVISSSAHRIGVWWHEQVKQPDGTVEWKQHEIDNTFSQSHSLMAEDMNTDGKMDYVTGKRWWAHGPNGDVNPGDPAVLVWYEYKRGSGGQVEWVKHQIDNDSGVGTGLCVTRLIWHKPPDIIIANKKGVFLFQQVAP